MHAAKFPLFQTLGRRALPLLVLTLGLLAGATPALAQWGPPPGMPYGGPSEPAHDGLWLRAHAGLAYASSKQSYSDGDVSASGLGLTLGGQFGAALRQDLILHLDVAVVMVRDPAIAVAHGGTSTDYGNSSGDLSPVFFGAGATTYFGPAFLSVAVGAAAVALGDTQTGIGYGINVLAGLEGQIRRRSFLGGALQLLFTSVPHADTSGDSPWVNTLTFGFVLMSGYR